MKPGILKKFRLSISSLSSIQILQVLRKISRTILWILFLGTICSLAYLWYESLYRYQWSEEQKKQYRSEYAGQTTFRAERFDHTVDVLRERIRLHEGTPRVKKDIFRGVDL